MFRHKQRLVNDKPMAPGRPSIVERRSRNQAMPCHRDSDSAPRNHHHHLGGAKGGSGGTDREAPLGQSKEAIRLPVRTPTGIADLGAGTLTVGAEQVRKNPVQRSEKGKVIGR